MKSIQLAYNKISSSTLLQVFKEIKREYEKSPHATADALVSVIRSTDTEASPLVTASFMCIAHKMDANITKKVLESTKGVALICYLQAMGVVDNEYVRQATVCFLKKRDLISVLKVLQMCGAVIDKETAKQLKTGIEVIVKDIQTDAYLPHFLIWALTQLSKGSSPFREVLKEEISSMKSTISEIEENEGLSVSPTLTVSTDRENVIAAKYGMNTALKKRIFSILTTSPSHQKAISSFYKEALKVKQFEEVFFLLLFLCLKESRYNSYYAEIAICLVKVASSNHKKPFTKYIYASIERVIFCLDTLQVKELYHLALYMAALCTKEVISLKHLDQISFSFSKSRAFARVLFKALLQEYRSKSLPRVQRAKESAKVAGFFRNKLIDNKILKEGDREELEKIYLIIYKCA